MTIQDYFPEWDPEYDRLLWDDKKEILTDDEFSEWNQLSIEQEKERSRQQWLHEGNEPTICNNCGEECDYHWMESHEKHGLIGQRYSGGFSSPALEDCTTYYFSICEHCLKDMFNSFAIPVDEGEYHVWTGEEVKLSKYKSRKDRKGGLE